MGEGAGRNPAKSAALTSTLPRGLTLTRMSNKRQ